MDRRTFILMGATSPFVFAALAHADNDASIQMAPAKLTQLETSSGGRLGLYAIDTGSGATIAHRAHECFPMCSTFKVMAVGAVLAQSERTGDLLHRRIHFPTDELVSYSPVTGKHVSDGMIVSELCAAALQFSDNTAGNQLIKLLGGPSSVTAYARSIGDREFRLDRWETALNSAIPGDLRDTTTPSAMAHSLNTLLLGKALSPPQRAQLVEWLRGNTTGGKRIRAALPADWQTADKTGSGDYGTTNDIAVFWPTGCKPVVLAIYYTQNDPKVKWRDEVLVAATRIVLSGLGLAR
jgi:beta-lactamase class A